AGTSSCRTRSEHPPGQGNGRSTEPGAAACPTYRGNIRQTGASDHHLRANIPGDGPSAIRRKNIRQTGRTTAGPRASIQARVWAITGWAAGPPDFGPKASRQCWGAVRRDGVVAGVLVQFTFGGILALRSGNL